MKTFSGKYLRNNQGYSWGMFSVQCTSLEQTVLGHGQVGDRGCVLSLPTLLALSPSPGAVGSQGAHGARLHPEVPVPLSWGWQQGDARCCFAWLSDAPASCHLPVHRSILARGGCCPRPAPHRAGDCCWEQVVGGS